MNSKFKCSIQGPQGGPGGKSFSLEAAGSITAVHIRCGGWIDAIQLSYRDEAGAEDSTEKAGGNGGRLEVLRLTEGEHITHIHGAAGTYVDTLIIETSKGRKIAFGNLGAPLNFTYAVPAGHQLAGFCGRSEQYVHAIGILTVPEVKLPGSAGGFGFIEGLA